MAAPTASHWLLAFPFDKPSVPQVFDTLVATEGIVGPKSAAVSADHEVARVFAFPVYGMKVGTLDGLMRLSDDLARADSFCEGVLRKTERQVADSHVAFELAKAAAAVASSGGAEGGAGAVSSKSAIAPFEFTVGSLSAADYVRQWRWDSAQFDPRDPLPELLRSITAASERVEGDLRSISSLYTEKRTALTTMERKKGGNLLSCNLDSVITEPALRAASAEFIPEAWEYTATQVVVMPKTAEEAFLASYETLAPEAVPFGPPGARTAVHGSPVVPGSARKVAEDKDGYVLYIVAVLKKYVDGFRAACREKRYTVRDHVYDPTAAGRNSKALADLQVEVNGALSHLRDQARSKYGEALSLALHMKSVRLFCEAVLRYGLPAGYDVGKSAVAAVWVIPSTAARGPSIRKTALAAIKSAWSKTSLGSGAASASGGGGAAGGAGGSGKSALDDAYSGATDDPVIPGVTEGGAASGTTASFPFVLLEMDVRKDTASLAK